MSSRRLRVGFVGGGWVTMNRHLPAAKAQPELVLAGIVTATPQLDTLERSKLTQRYGLRHFTSDLSESWFRQDVDVVVIGTPPETHHELVMSCLRMGKHVLVEIPMADNLADAEQLVRVQAQTGVVAMVDHVRRFNPSHQWIHN